MFDDNKMEISPRMDKAMIQAVHAMMDPPALTPPEIASLPWPKKSRYGIADKQTKSLVHGSDSEAWIQAEFWMMNWPEGADKVKAEDVQELAESSRYQVVIRI